MENKKLTEQKELMKRAIAWIEIIQTCDQKIEDKNHPEYFKTVRSEAVIKYAEAMVEVVEGAFINAKMAIAS